MKTVILKEEELEYASVYTTYEPKATYTHRGEQLIEIIRYEKEEVMNDMPISVYWKNKEGVILGCNHYCARIAGYNTKEDFIGVNAYDLTPLELTEKIKTIDKMVIEQGITHTTKEYVELGGGRKLCFLVIKMPFRNHKNEIIGIKGISIDITEQESAKKQASDSGLSAGTVAHDIKNDIHSLGLNAEKASWLMEKLSTEKVLEKSSLSPKDIEFLYEYPKANLKTKTKMTQTVDASLAHLQEVITGNYAAVSEDYEVYPILSLVQEVMESYAHHREVPFIHLQHIKDFEFFGSYQLVSKIVGNLFNNALRQMDKYGQGEIFINSIENEHFYILKIKDTAGHVSPERINELFIAYKTGNVAGTGFGLSSAKLFMERMGGDIQAKLIETDKIEFELYFPKLDDATLELGVEED